LGSFIWLLRKHGTENLVDIRRFPGSRKHPHFSRENLAVTLPHDLDASVRIAEWTYEQTEQANGQVWVAKGVFRHLGPECRRLLVA
jgi:uncharacterized protein (DUF488 family)